jgi:uncharacterized damage-inducible protein DinB
MNKIAFSIRESRSERSQVIFVMLLDGLEMFRSTRSRTLALTANLTQAQMDYAPASGRWSVGEVLDHLLLGEKLNRGYIAEVIEMKKAGRRPVLRLSFADVNVSLGYIPKSLLPFVEVPFTLLNLFLPASVRDFMTLNRLIPAQNADQTAPRRGRSADELRQELISSLRETEALLEANSHLDYREMLVQHPLMGANDIPGLLRFLALHEQRHQAQINDVLTSSRFPKST